MWLSSGQNASEGFQRLLWPHGKRGHTLAKARRIPLSKEPGIPPDAQPGQPCAPLLLRKGIEEAIRSRVSRKAQTTEYRRNRGEEQAKIQRHIPYNLSQHQRPGHFGREMERALL